MDTTKESTIERKRASSVPATSAHSVDERASTGADAIAASNSKYITAGNSSSKDHQGGISDSYRSVTSITSEEVSRLPAVPSSALRNETGRNERYPARDDREGSYIGGIVTPGDDHQRVYEHRRSDSRRRSRSRVRSRSRSRSRRSRSRSRSRGRSSRRRSRSRSSHRRSHRRSRRSHTRSRSPHSRRRSTSPSKLFWITSKAEANQYIIGKDLVKHANKSTRVFFAEKDIQEQVLDLNPVPKDIMEAPKMDVVTLGVLERKNRTHTIAKDTSWRRVHTKIRDSFGPFARIWHAIDGACTKDNLRPIHLDLTQLRTYCEQTALLLGQAANTVSHLRRKALLSNITSEKVAKSLMTSHKKVFEEEDPYNEIIPDRVWDKVSDTSKEVEMIAKAVRADKQPFRKGSLQSAARSSGPSSSNIRVLPAGTTKPFPPKGGKDSTITHIVNSPVETEISGNTPTVIGGASRTQNRVKIGRAATIFRRPVEVVDKRSGDPRLGGRLGDSLDQHSTSHQWEIIHSQRRGRLGSAGNSKIAGQRSHTGDTRDARSSVIKPVLTGEKGWLPETHSEFKKSESVRSVYPFQNGKSERGEKPPQKERFHGENRSQRCLLHRSTTSKFTEIREVSMEESHLSISVPLFRAGASPKIVHKTHEGTYVYPKTAGDKTDYLPGRHPDIRILTRGDRASEGHHVVPVRKSGICHQQGEVRVDSSEDNGILRGAHKQHGSVNVTDRSKDSILDKTLQSGTRQSVHVLERSQQAGGEIDFNISRNNTLHVTGEASPATANPQSTNTGIIRVPCQIGQKIQTGVDLVDREPQTESGEAHNDEEPGPNHLLGCSDIRGMGGLLSGSGHRGSVDSAGKGQIWKQHKHVGTHGSRISHQNILENASDSQEHPSHDRQQDSLVVLSEDGGHEECAISRENQTDLGFSAGEGDHDYCRVYTLRAQRGSGPRIAGGVRLERMETSPLVVQGGLLDVRNTGGGSVCIQDISPDSKIYVPEGGSKLPGSRRITTEMDTGSAIRVPSIQSHRESTTESASRGSFIDIDCSSLGHSALVPIPNGTGCGNTSTSTKTRGGPRKPRGGGSSIVSQRDVATECLGHIRTEGSDNRVSGGVGHLLANSRKLGTRRGYDSAWKKFSGWCRGRKVDPFQCSVQHILEFLAALFQEGYSYSSIGNARSAISAYHGLIGDRPVGEHPEVTKLMKGASNLRPVCPKYCSTWDVDQVLRFVTSLGDNKDMVLMDLCQKTVFLLAITSAHRGKELTLLKIHLMNTHALYISFKFEDKFKTSGQNETARESIFHRFRENTGLCPAAALESLLERNREHRVVDDITKRHLPTEVFLATKEPFQAVGRSTIARWLVTLIGRAGIDMHTYSGHSTRSASTSKAASLGVPIDVIVKQANWKLVSTFEKFYHKPIDEGGKLFQTTVLGLKK